jgi:hypothetical protein
MRLPPLAVVVALAAGVAGCAARAEVPPPEPELPVLEPPPAPPRIVAIYVEPEEPAPIEVPAAAEPTMPPRPQQPRPATPAPQPGPVVTTEGPPAPPPPPALTLTPVPGAESKTEASIRTLLGQVTRDLDRVNSSGLSADGRTQFETARRFVQQSQDALKVRNLLYAGKLADKAAAMAAVLVR